MITLLDEAVSQLRCAIEEEIQCRGADGRYIWHESQQCGIDACTPGLSLSAAVECVLLCSTRIPRLWFSNSQIRAYRGSRQGTLP